DDVGALPLHERDGVAPRRGLAHDLQVGLGAEEAGEAAPDEVLVVGQGDADHGASRGIVAATRKPPPPVASGCAGPAVRRPPSSSARSRIPSRPRPPVSLAGAADPAPSSTTSTWKSVSSAQSRTSAVRASAWRVTLV